jgi:NAD(P)-dependent dehydrogenase (short-subunit alcohol dehydrogenase family)
VLRGAMSATDLSELLRPGLLEGQSIVLACAASRADGSLGAAVATACAGLGARVCELELGDGDSSRTQEGQEGTLDDAVDRVLGECAGAVQMLVIDAASVFDATVARGGAVASARAPADVLAGPEIGRTALRACLEASWNATRAIASRAFLESGHGGRIVYLTPPPDAGGAEVVGHADAARAGLENLARTLSIEWARHAVTVVAIMPGARAAGRSSPAGEAAALTAYLASPAGAYFSGCLLDLRGTSRTAARAPSEPRAPR